MMTRYFIAVKRSIRSLSIGRVLFALLTSLALLTASVSPALAQATAADTPPTTAPPGAASVQGDGQGAAAGAQEQSTRDNVVAAQAEYLRLQDQVDAAAKRLSTTNADLELMHGRITQAYFLEEQAKTAALRALVTLRDRIRSAYKHDPATGYLELISAKSVNEFLKNKKMVDRLIQSDARVLRDAQLRAESYHKTKSDLKTTANSSQEAYASLENTQREVRVAQERQGAVVADLTKQLQAMSAARAEVLRNALEEAAKKNRDLTVAPLLAPGDLVCPVKDDAILKKLSLSNDWGDPRSGGRTHKGNDLFAPYGTPVVAIDNGTIIKTSPVEAGLGGITLTLQTALGDTFYYAHLSRLDVVPGQVVARGQVVGAVGNTGNARTTPPHVHFEMHPGAGDAVNPYGTLTRIC